MWSTKMCTIWILMTNVFGSPLLIPKILIAIGPEATNSTIAYGKLASSSKAEVSTVYYNESEDAWMRTMRIQHVATEEQNKKSHEWRQDIQVDETFNGYLNTFLMMMRRINDKEQQLLEMSQYHSGLESTRDRTGKPHASVPHIKQGRGHESLKNQKITKCWIWK